jgi:hypothetical protein
MATFDVHYAQTSAENFKHVADAAKVSLETQDDNSTNLSSCAIRNTSKRKFALFAVRVNNINFLSNMAPDTEEICNK